MDDVVDDDTVTVPDGDGVAGDKDPADLNVIMIIIIITMSPLVYLNVCLQHRILLPSPRPSQPDGQTGGADLDGADVVVVVDGDLVLA